MTSIKFARDRNNANKAVSPDAYHMMAKIRLPARRVLKSDAIVSLDLAQRCPVGEFWPPKAKISKGSGRRCDRLVVPVPCRQSRLAKTLGNSGHMSHYLRSSVLAKDWETSILSAESWLLIAHIKLVTRRLARA